MSARTRIQNLNNFTEFELEKKVDRVRNPGRTLPSVHLMTKMMPLHYVGHFALPHSDAFSSKPKISDCYYVGFVDKQPTQEKSLGGTLAHRRQMPMLIRKKNGFTSSLLNLAPHDRNFLVLISNEKFLRGAKKRNTR